MIGSNPSNADLERTLVARLLQAASVAGNSQSSSEHPSEEQLTLFAFGGVTGPQRDDIVRHLTQCEVCRQVASALLAGIAETEPLSRAPNLKAGFWRSWSGFALAAAVLLAVGLAFLGVAIFTDDSRAERRAYDQAHDLLRRGEFEQARGVLARTAAKSYASDRLRNLDAQARRRIPSTVALASVGRLADFGVDIGGVVARDARGEPQGDTQEALDLLNQCDASRYEIQLNRGHALLTLNRLPEALAAFRGVTERRTAEPLAWLGLGITHYLLEDYAAAERDFRECLRLEPTLIAARVNLAMTLEELEKPREALELWQGLLSESLSESERSKIEHQVQALRNRGKP